jgi:hypothetical protein
VFHWLRVVFGLSVFLPGVGLSQPEFLVTGVVSEAPAGRIILVLDRDGYPGQRRGDAIVFTMSSDSRVVSREGQDARARLAPREQANVTYYKSKAGALVVREIQLLGLLPASAPLPGRPAPASGGEGPRLTASDAAARLTEVRIQKTARQGDSDIDSVKAGTGFFIAFYVQVDAKTPLKLEYRCMRPDFDAKPRNGESLAPLPVCHHEETVPAGFRGVRYNAFKMNFAPHGATKASSDLIVAEMTPVAETHGAVVRAWQRKLKPVQILP